MLHEYEHGNGYKIWIQYDNNIATQTIVKKYTMQFMQTIFM